MALIARSSGVASGMAGSTDRALADDAEQQATQSHRAEVKIPVYEEQLSVGKQTVVSGLLRVHKTVHDHEVVVEEPLFSEEVEVQRVEVNRIADEPQAPHYVNDVLVIPVAQEVLIRKFLIREEIHVRRHRVETRAPSVHRLKYEQATIERVHVPDDKDDKPVP